MQNATRRVYIDARVSIVIDVPVVGEEVDNIGIEEYAFEILYDALPRFVSVEDVLYVEVEAK